jgi:DNA mismatch repair protein MutS
LAALETQQILSREQVDLFAAPPTIEASAPSAVEAAVAVMNPDALSPREALDALYQLKKLGGKP